MRKLQFILIFVLFYSTNLFSQKVKTKYYDENNITISKNKFKSAKEQFYFKKYFKNDTLIVGKLFLRIYKGKLTTDEKNDILAQLENSLTVKFDLDNTIIIHHFKNTCKTINEETSNENYLKLIKTIPKLKLILFQKKVIYQVMI